MWIHQAPNRSTLGKTKQRKIRKIKKYGTNLRAASMADELFLCFSIFLSFAFTVSPGEGRGHNLLGEKRKEIKNGPHAYVTLL